MDVLLQRIANDNYLIALVEKSMILLEVSLVIFHPVFLLEFRYVSIYLKNWEKIQLVIETYVKVFVRHDIHHESFF